MALVSLVAVHAHVDAAEGAHTFLKRPDAWFAGEEARQIVDNILSHQSDLGGWPKNVGIRVVEENDPKLPTGKNKVVHSDQAAPPIWARFYEIETNRPIFVDRDGVAKHNLAEIGYERRNGYAWLGCWPQTLLENEYPAWKRKWTGKP